MAVTQPARSAATSMTAGAEGSRSGSSTTRGSPKCAVIIARITAAAWPDDTALRSSSSPCATDWALPPSTSISAPRASVQAVMSSGPRPCSTSMASRVSRALPMVSPSGALMSVSSATTFLPAREPTRTRASASSRALSWSFMKAPRPTFTSSTRASMPSASFFDRMLATISGMLSTVAVTSRSA